MQIRRRKSRHQLREPKENQDFPDDLAFGVVGLVGLPLAEATPAGEFGDMTEVGGADFCPPGSRGTAFVPGFGDMARFAAI